MLLLGLMCILTAVPKLSPSVTDKNDEAAQYKLIAYHVFMFTTIPITFLPLHAIPWMGHIPLSCLGNHTTKGLSILQI